MRIVFFGTPAFAVPTLEALVASPHEIVAVVTQPDRPRGRGQQLAEPEVKVAAHRAGIPVSQPTRLKDDEWLAAFRAWHSDLAVVAAYGKILPQVLLEIPPRGFLNVHASLLPKYRGASPIQHAVMNGDAETGITIMRVVLALDAGPMLTRVARPIGPEETSAEVEADLARIGADLLLETLAALESGTAVETPQDESLATFAPRLTKDDGLIEWSLPAHALHDRVRGLQPWPEAFTFLDNARLVIVKGRAMSGVAFPAEPGTVVEAHRDRFVVATGHGTAFELVEVQPEGKRVMSSREFLAGRRVQPGMRLGPSGR